jgi:hypothetical protein
MHNELRLCQQALCIYGMGTQSASSLRQESPKNRTGPAMSLLSFHGHTPALSKKEASVSHCKETKEISMAHLNTPLPEYTPGKFFLRSGRCQLRT